MAVLAIGAMVTVAATASAVIPSPGPILLLNRTPSEPTGLYLREADPPRPGAIIAFRTPNAAFPYADRHLAYLHRRPLLKAVAAAPGDWVCTRNNVLAINGAVRAPIQRLDREGRALPRWSGCRQMRSDELFVFSSRVPNSFDSRYYGPVNRHDVLGVYRLALAL